MAAEKSESQFPDSMSKAPQSSAGKTVAIISKPDRPEFSEVLPALEKWLQQRDFSVIADKESAAYFPASKVVARAEMATCSPGLALVLGGDGTLLSASRAVAKVGTMILGVNLGTLGFLTELALADLYPALEAVVKGEYVVDSRAMLRCSLVRGGNVVATHHALNDVVVSKSAIARLNYFELFVDAEFVSSYKADGSDHCDADRVHRILAGSGRADPQAGCGCLRHHSGLTPWIDASSGGGARYG